jgi:hypothetical protein
MGLLGDFEMNANDRTAVFTGVGGTLGFIAYFIFLAEPIFWGLYVSTPLMMIALSLSAYGIFSHKSEKEEIE